MQYLQKTLGYEIDFLPADKHKNFLQIDSITLGVHDQTCPKHPKQQFYNIFAIYQGKRKWWSWFFPADNCQTLLQSENAIFDVCDQTDLLFLCNILRKFLHAGKHESLLQGDTMILMERVKHFQSSQNSKFIMSVQYLKKELRNEVNFLHADNNRSGLQVDFNYLGTKVGYKVILWLLISMIKQTILKIFAIFQEKLGIEFSFCM